MRALEPRPGVESERGEYNRGAASYWTEGADVAHRGVETACEIAATKGPEMPDFNPQFEMTVAEVAARDAAATQLIDVREINEWNEGRIAGGALIPLSEFAERVGEIDPARPIITYCRSGGRSLMVAEALQNAGYAAKSMAGGILAWEAAGLAVER